ncbi:MAG: ABC transporter ATP-binding protein [Isosphaeraceae bacterium]
MIDARQTLPGSKGAEVAAQLAPGESVLAWFEPDLDSDLNYVEGLVVLTNLRILDWGGHATKPHSLSVVNGNGKARVAAHWQSWPLTAVAEVRAREHAGLGLLDLLGPAGRLAHWRYTISRAPAAHRLVRRSESFRLDGQIEEKRLADPTCPSCGATLPPDQESCPICAPASAPPTTSSLFRLLQFGKPHIALALLGFALTLLATSISLIPTYLTSPLTNRVLIPLHDAKTTAEMATPFRLAIYYLSALAIAALLAWGLAWARSWVLGLVSERISADLRDQTYAHLQKLSLEYFGGKRTGDLMARISSDTERICNFLSINLLDFITDVLMIVGTVIVLIWMDPVLAAAALIPFPVIFWLVHHSRLKLRNSFDQATRAWGAMTNVLADTIPGIRVVKAFAQEQREVERFRKANNYVLTINVRVNNIWAFFAPTVALLTQGGLLVVWSFGVWRVSQKSILVGDLVAFQLFMARFYTRLEAMSRIVQVTQRAAAGAARIFEILDRVSSVAEPVRPVNPTGLLGGIELRGVGFRYGSRSVLQDVHLSIQPGEMIGLVGPTGAGKSTLVNLICRFYDVTEGSILIDGTDVRRFPVEEYRKHIGIVLQEPFLFFGTIAENIAYGRPETSRADVIAAARAAKAHEFILRLPDGYDSLVGERGQSLSGGERQRISIARALLIDPKILILDEATSAVDTETEREIQEALDNLTRGRTTIAIAHRLSTLRKADRLVVIERGRIAEVGRHHDLLKTPAGAYARLHRAQAEMAKAL